MEALRAALATEIERELERIGGSAIDEEQDEDWECLAGIQNGIDYDAIIKKLRHPETWEENR